MSLREEALQLNAFVDGELGLAAQLEMEARLRNDPALRRQADEALQLRELVRESADYHAAPQALRLHVATLRAPRPAPTDRTARVSSLAAVARRWLGWRALAASLSLAAVLAVAIDLAWLQASRNEQLADAVVASHVRSTLGQHLVDVASSDRHTVKPFLASKLGFSPPVDELRLPGSVFIGGRIDYLDDRPVAALVYRQGEHVVNSFVWPTRSADSQPGFSSERGYRLAHWSSNGMTHWLISDVNGDEFRALVAAVQRTDPAR